MYSKEDLKLQIKEMGILPTDTVLMHTSMRAVGQVENGADGVIDAFCEYLSDGLFIVPTHTWANVHRNQPVYDVRTSMPCIGALPCVAAFRKDGVRSLHPTHSVWAHGKNAEEFVRGEEDSKSPAPPGGAWSRLADVNAKILLVGVGNNRNTFIHSIDELAALPDRLSNDPFEIVVRDGDGNEYRNMYRSHSCSRTNDVSQYYVNFEKPMVALGAQKSGRLGSAEVRIVDARMCRDIIMKIYSRAESDIFVDFVDIPEEYYL